MEDRRFMRLRQYFRSMGIYARMDALWFVRDARTCLVCVFSELVATGATIAGMLLLAGRFGGLGGFSFDEVLFMQGFGLCAEGLCFLFFSNGNVSHPSRRYGRGHIDHMLMQPVPVWLQLLTDGFLPVSGCHVLVGGIVVLGIALGRLGIAVTAGWAMMFAAQLVSALAVMLGFLYLTAVPALYAQVAGEEISSTVYDFMSTLREFPLGAMPVWIRVVFTTVLPVGLMGWLPTAVLMESAPLWQAWIAPLLAALIGGAAIFFTWKGWRHYANVGSPRYKAGGLRN